MPVSAHRNTIAAAISPGVQARLSSVRSIEACLRAAGHARVHSVSTKPGASEFTRQILGEADEAGFAGAVSHARTGHVAAGNGRGVADGAARSPERARSRASAPEGAEQVGGEDGG